MTDLLPTPMERSISGAPSSPTVQVQPRNGASGAAHPTINESISNPRILVFGESSIVSRILLQELQRAGYGAVDGISFEDLQEDRLPERVLLAIVLVDIPPSRPLEVVRWFKARQPGIRLLLIWEGNWRGRDAVHELRPIPQIVMPFSADQLVTIVSELVAREQKHRSSGPVALPASRSASLVGA